MDKPKWKAGDTCQIKPKTAGVPAYQCGALWTVAHVKPNGEVGVHNGVPGNTEFFGMTIFITLSPSRLLPAGDARPMVAAEMGSEVLRLRARVAELEEAQRWRAVPHERPPVGVAVLGWWEGCDWPFGVVKWDGHQWWSEADMEDRTVRGPDRWLPLPGAPDAT